MEQPCIKQVFSQVLIEHMFFCDAAKKKTSAQSMHHTFNPN
jgi:hypothetical protein